MATKRPKRPNWDTYQDYLRSPEWDAVKRKYNEMFGLKDGPWCVICRKEKGVEHHHWRYPKGWNDDSPGNLVHLCKECHAMAHSVYDDAAWSPDSATFSNREDFILQMVYLRLDKTESALAEVRSSAWEMKDTLQDIVDSGDVHVVKKLIRRGNKRGWLLIINGHQQTGVLNSNLV